MASMPTFHARPVKYGSCDLHRPDYTVGLNGLTVVVLPLCLTQLRSRLVNPSQNVPQLLRFLILDSDNWHASSVWRKVSSPFHAC